MGDWSDFFVATAGSAAALTGLIFVGVSINITKIISVSKLPERALLALFLLLTILIVSCLMLVPNQPIYAVGLEVLISGITLYSTVIRMDIDIYRNTAPAYKRLIRKSVIMNQVSVLPYIVAGIVILCSGESGVYCIVAAFILSFIKALIDAWVLLVEINR